MTGRVKQFALFILSFEERSEDFTFVRVTYTDSVVDNLNLNLYGPMLQIEVVGYDLDFSAWRGKLYCIWDQVEHYLDGSHLVKLKLYIVLFEFKFKLDASELCLSFHYGDSVGYQSLKKALFLLWNKYLLVNHTFVKQELDLV